MVAKRFYSRTLIPHTPTPTPTSYVHSRSVRQAVARVISIIAKHEVPSNDWPDFMGWLNECASSESVLHREVCVVVCVRG